MRRLDHLTVIAPTLSEGVAHVRECLDIDVPFGTRHLYMGTHNHRLQLGNDTYLEVVALDPEGVTPPRARWFGVDSPKTVQVDWEAGMRLRGWVASTTDLGAVLSRWGALLGDEVSLPFDAPEFGFSIPEDGSLPMNGALPSWIDHRDEPTSMAEIPDLGARLQSFKLLHPHAAVLSDLYGEMEIEGAPETSPCDVMRYQAEIQTPNGLRVLT